jgi:glucokinase
VIPSRSEALPRLGIGIDIGGTSTKAALIDASGTVLATKVLPTGRGEDGVIATALATADAVLAASAHTLDDVEALGVGIPGTVDPTSGTVRLAVNVGIGVQPLALGARLGAELGRPVHVENDVRAAALGADWSLATAGEVFDDLAYLSIGTGIAAGHVQEGRLRRGSHQVAGEIGHVPVDPAGPLCACGQTGCIEAISSGAAIERLWPTAGGAAAIELHRAASAGDAAAERIWASVIGGLGTAVLMLALTLDPQVIVLSGGVAALGAPLCEAIADRLAFDGRHSDFLASLDLGARLRIIHPSVPLGAIGAIRAAHAASVVTAP